MKPIIKFLGACIFYFYNHFISQVPVYWIRHTYLRFFLGIKIGEFTSIHMGCFFTGRKITFGSHTAINRRCYLDGRAGLRIGNNVNISPECYLLTLTHDLQDPEFHPVGKEVVIEDHAWLGARAIVMPGVKICEGGVVGAGAVVTSEVAPYTIVAGVPAKKIGERKREISGETTYFPFFDTDIQV